MKQNKLGRKPINAKAMTSAERQRRHREKLKLNNHRVVTIELSNITIDILDEFRELTGTADSRSETIEDILQTWALDTSEAMPQLRKQIEVMKKQRGDKQ